MILASIYPCPFDTQVRHDFSSAIYKNGKIYAYEEDKANGYKNNSNYMFPELSLFYGFKELKITPSDVDIWLLPEPSKRFKKRELYVFFSHILKCYEGNENNFLKWVNKKIVFIKHHDSHLGLAVASSGFKKAIYLSIDGGGDFGDERNSVYGEYSNNKFKNLANLNGLDNICSFHAFITDFLCFGIDNGKVGGLAAYGKIQKKLYDELDKLIEVKNNGIKFHRKRFLKSKYNINKFSFDGYQRYKVLNTQPSSTNILKKCKGYLVEDVAKTSEELIKDKLYDFLKIIKKRSNFENIVFSGGLFLNIGLNGFISEKKMFKKYFFNLAPHDSGLSLGAISYYLLKSNKKLYKLNKLGLDPYIGPSFSNEEVIKIIKKFNLSYEKISNYHYDVAKNISNKKIVGIFNGRAEFGQRSLGNRSILADPRSANSKKRLNLLLKKRDWFMPFAPAIPIEYFHKWFPNQHPSYYMQVTNTIKDRNIAKKIPSAVHVDFTCRSQVVEQNINKDFWKIIHQFNKITDIPIVLNTSFNRHGISTISNPRQAIEHLLEGCFDVLYINKIKIKNTKVQKSQLKNQQIKISESMLLKQENYKWYKKNKYLLDSKDKKRFNFFLKQKFENIN